MMTSEDYVSLETAKMLKGKGYDEECAYYIICDEDGHVRPLYASTVSSLTKTNKILYKCPTLYEAQKWLRQKHNLHINVGIWGDYSIDADGNKVDERQYWAFDTYFTTNIMSHIFNCDGEYDTYEQALDAGIREALKLI